MIELILEFLVASLIVLGGAFALIGSWGLHRLPDLMSRLHGPTKATTLGVGGCLVASMIYFPTHGMSWSAHELLITLFLFITAPISANMIAKAYLHGIHRPGRLAQRDHHALPHAPHKQTDWATFGWEAEVEKSSGTDKA
jgi:monovalent cation/proton antiporter, MnhG/PhaG subunit